MPRWLAGSKYLNGMQSMCTASTHTFLQVQLLVSKGEDVSRYDECHLLYELSRFADGVAPIVTEHWKHLLVDIEARDPFNAAEDVIYIRVVLLRRIPELE
jgi:hypothetical protein